jgi:L-rhamnose mutarotase
MPGKRYCFTLDLQDDPGLIAEYKRHHENVWPEVLKSIRDAGIHGLEIYLLGTRMFMVMEVDEKFSFESKARLEQSNSKVQVWEQLMWRFQKALPGSKPGEKWLLMEKIFEL